jgi:hypothetical protein
VRVQTNDGNSGIYSEIFVISIDNLDEEVPVVTLLGSTPITLEIGDSYSDA